MTVTLWEINKGIYHRGKNMKKTQQSCLRVTLLLTFHCAFCYCCLFPKFSALNIILLQVGGGGGNGDSKEIIKIESFRFLP